MKEWMIVAVVGASAVAPQALPAAQPLKATGIYSDMSFNQESGDVLGIELYVVLSSKGYVVVFQSSEGEPTVPVVVVAKIEGDTIEFELPPGCAYAGRFTGTLTDEGITGTFPSGRLGPKGNKIIRLKRGKGYWQ